MQLLALAGKVLRNSAGTTTTNYATLALMIAIGAGLVVQRLVTGVPLN
jgi:hypothetical protein